MAVTSGTVYSSYAKDSRLYVSWNIAETDKVNNRSKISWTAGVIISGGNKWYSNAVKINSVYIDGGESLGSGTYSNFTSNGTYQKLSGSKWVSHNSIGAKNITVSISGWFYSNYNVSGSNSFDLTTIPRAGSMDSLVGSTNYLDGVFTYKYTPKSTSFYNRLRVSIPSVVVLQTVNLGTKAASQQTATYTLSTALLESIYNRYPNASTCTLGFVLETYSDSGYSTKIGESTELTLTKTFPLSVAPSVGGIAWTKTSSEPSTWPMTQGVSKGTMSMTGVSGKYGSTIKSYSLTFAGLSSTSDSLTVSNIASSGTLKAVATVTDSRGRTSAPKEVPFTVAEYLKPQLTVLAYRSDDSGVEDDYGDYMSVKATVAVTAVGNNSLQSLVLQYKKRSGVGYTSVSLSSGVLKTVSASSDYTWDWVVTATDMVNPSTANDSIGTGEVVLDIMADGSGIGLGKVAEIPNAVDSKWAFAQGGNLQTDFIVGQGTSGYWFYRKWASGRAEAWTTSEISFTQTPSAIMGGYYTSGQIDLPVDVFSNPPNCVASGRIGTGLGFASISTTTATMVSLGIFGNQNATTSYITSIYAMGRWK